MRNRKVMSDDGNKRESNKSDSKESGSSKDFDFYGFTQTFAYCFAVSVLISLSLVVSSYSVELYNYSLQAQNWITVARVVGVVLLFTQIMFVATTFGVGYQRRKENLSGKIEKA